MFEQEKASDITEQILAQNILQAGHRNIPIGADGEIIREINISPNDLEYYLSMAELSSDQNIQANYQVFVDYCYQFFLLKKYYNFARMNDLILMLRKPTLLENSDEFPPLIGFLILALFIIDFGFSTIWLFGKEEMTPELYKLTFLIPALVWITYNITLLPLELFDNEKVKQVLETEGFITSNKVTNKIGDLLEESTVCLELLLRRMGKIENYQEVLIDNDTILAIGRIEWKKRVEQEKEEFALAQLEAEKVKKDAIRQQELLLLKKEQERKEDHKQRLHDQVATKIKKQQRD